MIKYDLSKKLHLGFTKLGYQEKPDPGLAILLQGQACRDQYVILTLYVLWKGSCVHAAPSRNGSGCLTFGCMLRLPMGLPAFQQIYSHKGAGTKTF